MGRKGCFLAVSYFRPKLLVIATIVQSREHRGFSKELNTLVNTTYGVGISFGCDIFFSVVDAEAYRSVFGLDKHYWRSLFWKSWVVVFPQKYFIDLYPFKFQSFWPCKVRWWVYWLGILTLTLNAMLGNAHLFNVAVPYRLKHAELAQKFDVVFHVLVRKLYLALPIGFEFLTMFCFHVLIA